MRRFVAGHLLLLVLLAAAGCGQVTWQRRLAQADLPNRDGAAQRPSIFIETGYLYELVGDGKGLREPPRARARAFADKVKKVALESTLFSRVADAPDDADLQAKIEYFGSVEFKSFLGSPDGQFLTLGLGPLNHLQKWRLRANVTGQGGVSRTYEVEDELTVELGPLGTGRLRWGFDGDAFSQGMENMIRTIFRKMLDDQLL